MSAVPGSSSTATSSVGGWIRNSVARSSFGRKSSVSSGSSAVSGWQNAAAEWLGVGAELEQVDPSAAFHTFSKHWQQTCEIMDRTRNNKQVFQDDVTAVINHLGQMVTLLQVDIRQIMTKDRPTDETPLEKSCEDQKNESKEISNNCTPSSIKPYVPNPSIPPSDPPITPIFDHFLGEEILDKILEWSLGTGEFANSLKLEQLKMHEILLSQSRQELLVYKPVIRPLIRLLDSCLSCIPVEVERHLVLLLNQLCASLLHNQQLLNFFFLSSPNEQGDAKFLIFSLLLPFVHREGDLGQQARDALLLCMALSNTNPAVGQYIADTSNFCPLLAAGMCGLYSTLPRILPPSLTSLDGWHLISPQDVPLIPNLQVFLNALEFCNAVVQVAHPVVRNELVELVYQGFLVLVLGPALHQDGAISDTRQDFSAPPVNMEEVVTATVYVDLFLSYATEPQLRRAFLAFLLTAPSSEDSNTQPTVVINTLISRLHSTNNRVCLITLQLFTRIIDCWCEDALYVLVFQYLLTGSHVMVSHRQSALCHTPPSELYRIIDLLPSALKHEEKCNLCSFATCDESSIGQTIPYHMMLRRARGRIHRTTEACSKWVWKYDGQHPTTEQALHLVKEAKTYQPQPYPKLRTVSNSEKNQNSNAPLLGVSENERRSSSLPGHGRVVKSSLARIAAGGGSRRHLNLSHDDEQQPDSLGENSSGYESFNIRTSRDSSPSSLGPSSSPLQNRKLKGKPKKQDFGSEIDEEFLEELVNWDVKGGSKEELSDESLFNEIDEAFSSYGISSPQHTAMSQDSDDDCDVNWDEPSWSSPPSPSLSPPQPHSRPSIGPFLEALIERVDSVLTSSVPISQLTFSLLIKLASCPAPLLSSLLLNPSVQWQPAVRSLYQVLSSVKNKIDNSLTEADSHLLSDARLYFSGGNKKPVCTLPGEKIKMIPQHHNQTVGSSSSPFTVAPSDGNGKKRSLSAAVSALFKKANSPSPSPKTVEEKGGVPLQHLPNNSGFRYIRQTSETSSPTNSPSLFPQSQSLPPYTSDTESPHTSSNYSSVLTPYPSSLHGMSSPSSLVLPGNSAIALSGNSAIALPGNPNISFSSSIAPPPQSAQSHAKVHSARCALMLRELLLELTALAQGHAVFCPNMIFNWSQEDLDKMERSRCNNV